MRGGNSALGLTGSILEVAHGDGAKFLAEGGGRAIAIGVVLAILSALANGSFAVLSKTRSMRRAHVSPLIFNFWACLGVVISSFLVLVKFRFVFALEGLLSGLFFVLSFINVFRAVRLLGVSVAYGIWAGVAGLVSFMAREVVEGATKSLFFAGLSILITIIGIVGVALAGHMGWNPQDVYDDDEQSQSLIQSQVLTGEPAASRSFPAGVFSAVLAGVLGGLVMIPAIQAPSGAQGNAFLPSFGIAVAIFTPIATGLPYISGSCEIPDFAAQVAAVPGILSGIVWNVGNILSIMAIFYVGYSVAYPLFQCGIIIAGIWGMLYFEELSGNALVTFWAADIVVLAGIFLLSITH